MPGRRLSPAAFFHPRYASEREGLLRRRPERLGFDHAATGKKMVICSGPTGVLHLVIPLAERVTVRITIMFEQKKDSGTASFWHPVCPVLVCDGQNLPRSLPHRV